METTIYTQILPKGSVIMWYGEPDKLPYGWELCDGGGEGENKRPDLLNRFPVGAGDRYKKGGDPGGHDTITLSVDQMPGHSHTGTTDRDGAHVHKNFQNSVADNDDYDDPHIYIRAEPIDNLEFNIWSNGSEHQHRFTTDTAGKGDPIEIIPPYVALYFIIKTKD